MLLIDYNEHFSGLFNENKLLELRIEQFSKK